MDVTRSDFWLPDVLHRLSERDLRGKLQLAGRTTARIVIADRGRNYSEIRLRMGITGNIYETAKRCHNTLLRIVGGALK